MKNIFILLFSILFPLHLFAQTNIDRAITIDGKTRTYTIHLPWNYQAIKTFPILFALHGSGGKSEETQRLFQLDPLADKYGWIVIYPQAIYKNWNIPGISSFGDVDTSANDLHFISTLIDSVSALYKGDSTQIYVTGLSRGGKFALYLASKLNSRIRAVAAVCASIPRNMEPDYRFNKPIPVLLINGTADPLVNYNGGYGRLNVGQNVGPGFDMMPTDALVGKLRTLNNCDSIAVVTDMPNTNAGDDCTATKSFYKSHKAPVEFIRVNGGGHTWPGSLQYMPKFIIGNVCRDFNASDEIFNFFILASKQ
jgi:polyhydroxybutyrate depolymerase